MSFVVTSVVLGAAVADAGTVTIEYPAGTNQAFFTGANASADGAVTLNDNERFRELPSGVRVNFTYGGSNITLTNNTGITWPAGSVIRAQLGRAGNDRPGFQPNPAIADAATRGASYVQAEANATVATVNAILRALRAQGIIGS
jgi:hypothetical protein